MILYTRLRRQSSFRKASRSRQPATIRTRPALEWLEKRVVLSSYVVTNTGLDPTVAGTLANEIGLAIGDTSAVISFSNTVGTDATITLSASYLSSTTTYGPTAFVITGNTNITIDGSGAPGLTISGNNVVRPFAVTDSATLTLENLTIAGGKADGKFGGGAEAGGGGGGGAGLGGAVYDDGGTFTAEGVTFANNVAQGGDGGYTVRGGYLAGGGGGGLIGSGRSEGAGGSGGEETAAGPANPAAPAGSAVVAVAVAVAGARVMSSVPRVDEEGLAAAAAVAALAPIRRADRAGGDSAAVAAVAVTSPKPAAAVVAAPAWEAVSSRTVDP